MKYITLFLAIILLSVGCSSTQTTKQIDFLGEKGQVEYYNFEKSDLPIVVVIPSVFNSLLNQEQIENLAKGRRLVVIHFISADDHIRAMQVDNFDRRINYYSEIINQTELAHGSIDYFVAEGLNAAVGSRLISNFPFKQAWFINAWNPSIKMHLVNNCFTNSNARCDSLISYLEIGSMQNVDDLFNDVDSGYDRLYGNYTIRMWSQMFDYRMDNNLINKKCPVRWIYTDNTGLIEKEKANASQNIDLYSVKEFKKKKNLLSN